jgi:hypothetical protein
MYVEIGKYLPERKTPIIYESCFHGNSICLFHNFRKLQIILKIQTSLIPSYQIENFSVSPDLNIITLLKPKRNKFPHTTYTIKIYFAL